MKHTRIISTLFALIFCTSAIIGCSSGGTADAVTESQGKNEATSALTEAVTADPYADELDEYNFNGDEFHMYSRTTASINGAMNVEEETGDALNDAIYLRNRSVEERFNAVISETTNESNTDAARTAVLAGDDTYDIITTRCVYAYNYAGEGLVIPVTDIPNIDLEKAYWSDHLTSEMTILGKSYFAVGDFMLSGYDFTHILLFNKQMIEDFNFGNMYDIVNNGKWTFDKYTEMGVTATADINGDGVMDATDRYGYVATPKQILPNFWISGGLTTITKNADDIPEFALPGNEKFYDLINKVFEMHWDSGLWYQNDRTYDINPDFLTMFANGLSLFCDCSFYRVSELRAMDADFGIIPYPKYDEAQEKYYSRIEGCDLFCVPVTNKNTEFTGVMLEALACESAKTVMPAYYEITLQGKITRDDESIDMIDLISDNRTFDWGDTIWCREIRDGAIVDMFTDNDRDLASKLAEMETLVGELIKTNVETFSKLN